MTGPEGSAVEPRWDTPELGVRTIKVMLVYFAQTYGRGRLEQAWRDAKLPLPLAHVEDLSNYVSLAFVTRLFSALVEASGDPGFLDRAGRHIATPEALGFTYYLLRGVGTPQLVYQKTIELSPTYNRVGTFTVEESHPTRLVLTYRSRVPESDRSLCVTRMANFAAFPTIWGLPEAKVEELQCQVRGAECCRYAFSWQNRPPLGWRRFAGLAVGGAAALALAWTGAPPAPVVASLLALCGFTAGAWLDARVAARLKDALLAEQTGGLTRSVEELQRRADEVFKANVELDHRVSERTLDLQGALARLEQLDRLKSEFFANVSHELRTPLTLILSPVEARLSRPPPLAPGERELFEGVRRNAHRLLRLIDDLLDLSRIDAGHLRLDVVPVDLAALARGLVDTYRGGAEVKGVALSLDAPAEAPGAFGDLHRLDSVVSNLLGNAFKYTPAGGAITVTVSGSEAELRLSVADTGPGIAPEDLAHVFERYYQVSSAAHRGAGGVGIGLALAKNLTELHGGRLEVATRVGEGSTFTLVLPRGREHFRPEVLERRRVNREVAEPRRTSDLPTPTPRRAAAPTGVALSPDITFDGGRRARVLVVEDNDEVRALLKETLEASVEVLEARDGAEGLAAALRERPDLVLTDLMMPGLSGSEVCAALKATPGLQATPVVLLTARSGPDAALEGFAAGADEFVEKPFHPRVLLARVLAQLRMRALLLRFTEQARFATVGTLAAGVGHEVRNPVNAVLNGARVLLGRTNQDAESRQLLDLIVEGAGRIERISAALLTHASPAEGGGARPVDVREGLDSTWRLLEHRGEGVEIIRTYATEAMVLAAAGEVNQVFLNLLDNALRSGAKRLWFAVSDAQQMVRVEIADDGPGVPPELAPRIFDAFFTTRPAGEGSGLGLALSRDLVQRWGGSLAYSPRAGGGAAFTVELPREP